MQNPTLAIDQLIRSMYTRTIDKTHALLDTMTNINLAGSNGSHPLHEAIFINDFNLVKLLVKRGADVSLLSKEGTPLFVACKTNNYTIAHFLLTHGAEAESAGPGGATALMEAVKYKNTKIIRLLLKKGANPECQMPNGQNALMQAIEDGSLPIIKLLNQFKTSA